MSNLESLWKNWTNSNYDTATKERHTKTKINNEWGDFTNQIGGAGKYFTNQISSSETKFLNFMNQDLAENYLNKDNPDYDPTDPTPYDPDDPKSPKNRFVRRIVKTTNDLSKVTPTLLPTGWLKDLEIALVVVGVAFLGLIYVSYENRETISGYAKSASKTAVKYGKYAALL